MINKDEGPAITARSIAPETQTTLTEEQMNLELEIFQAYWKGYQSAINVYGRLVRDSLPIRTVDKYEETYQDGFNHGRQDVLTRRNELLKKLSWQGAPRCAKRPTPDSSR